MTDHWKRCQPGEGCGHSFEQQQIQNEKVHGSKGTRQIKPARAANPRSPTGGMENAAEAITEARNMTTVRARRPVRICGASSCHALVAIMPLAAARGPPIAAMARPFD